MAYKRTSPQPIVEGGTGRAILTNHGVLVGAGTSAITQLAVGTTGQVLTGVTGADPVFASPAASSITITGDSGGGLTGNSFTFTGGTTGLTFAGAGTTETFGGTLAIANGGTNATSMSTSTGIVKYDGTRLVTSSTAKIDSSNRMTNTSQPAFNAFLNNSVSNVTGDGTAYTIIFNSTVFDQASNFNTSTGTFTAPITGRYMLGFSILGLGLTSTENIIVEIVTTARTYVLGNTGVYAVSESNNYINGSVLADMSANDTATIIYLVSAGTKNIGVYGDVGTYRTYFYGYLVC